VNVAVDQAGHERAALAVDHVGLRGLDRLPGDLADRLTLDEDRESTLERVSARIEQAGVLEQDLRHSKVLRCVAMSRARRSCHGPR
jgi:hypothetical protein